MNALGCILSDVTWGHQVFRVSSDTFSQEPLQVDETPSAFIHGSALFIQSYLAAFPFSIWSNWLPLIQSSVAQQCKSFAGCCPPPQASRGFARLAFSMHHFWYLAHVLSFVSIPAMLSRSMDSDTMIISVPGHDDFIWVLNFGCQGPLPYASCWQWWGGKLLPQIVGKVSHKPFGWWWHLMFLMAAATLSVVIADNSARPQGLLSSLCKRCPVRSPFQSNEGWRAFCSCSRHGGLLDWLRKYTA